MNKVEEDRTSAEEVAGSARGALHVLLAEHKRILLLVAAVGAAIYVLSALVEDLLEQEPFAWDRPILEFVHSFSSPAADRLALFLSGPANLAFTTLLPVAVFLVLLYRAQVRDAVFVALSVGGLAILIWGVKLLLRRTRPDLWVSIAPETTFSFPSGHTASSAGVVIAMYVIARETWQRIGLLLIGVPLALLIAFSRVYLGVHYPSDLAGGWATALVWIIGIWAAVYGHPAKAVRYFWSPGRGGESE